jgi:Fe-S cluster assembly protein SufB
MSSTAVKTLVNQPYKYGFVTDIEADTLPRGLNEDIVRLISAKKNEPQFMLDFRLAAYRHWLTMKAPEWADVHYPPINYQDISYYAAPKSIDDKIGLGAANSPEGENKPKSMYDIDP